MVYVMRTLISSLRSPVALHFFLRWLRRWYSRCFVIVYGVPDTP